MENTKAFCLPYTLHFSFTARTSRGAMQDKETFFILIRNETCIGLGEAAPLKGLSPDDREDFRDYLEEVTANLPEWLQEARSQNNGTGIIEMVLSRISPSFPAIRFGVETALTDYLQGGERQLYASLFRNGERGIPINGLIWMGDRAFMNKQIETKLEEGFHVIKMKVGALDFEAEKAVIEGIRKKFSADQLSIRLDANGAYGTEEALEKLRELERYSIHSIEQPVPAGRPEEMMELVSRTPVPVALDEELIGINNYSDKRNLLSFIRPHYIILKPTLTGGIRASSEWIDLAEERGIGWWLTSALESDVGLNAVAQFAGYKEVDMPQGLGTGRLYTNNIPSPLTLSGDELWYDLKKEWDFSALMPSWKKV